TLIEILVSVVIFSFVMMAIARFGLDISGNTISFGESLEVQEELSVTLKIMATELRTMGSADTGAYPIAVAAGNTITFYSDYDGDGRFEKIRYFMNGTTLWRGVTKSS